MEMIRLKPFGMFGTNSFIIYSGDSAALIDAPGNTEEITDALAEKGLTLKYILLTHGHCDHIMGLADIAAITGAEVYIHENDLPKLTDDHLNLTEFFGLPPVKYYHGAKTVSNNDTVMLGDTGIKVMSTPGHTSGSVMYIAENMIFSGDTLFAQGVGRTDMPDGSTCTLRGSLKAIAALKDCDNYDVCPGHGLMTTLGYEKQNNPYLC